MSDPYELYPEGQRILDAANLEDLVYGGTPYELAERVIAQFQLRGFYMDDAFEEASPDMGTGEVPEELALLFEKATKELT